MTIIGVSGGSGSGKTTLTSELRDYIGADKVIVLNLDMYYKSPKHDKLHLINFDTPDAFDLDLLVSNLRNLKNKRDCYTPVYDFHESRRKGEVFREWKPIILVEGTLILKAKKVRDLLDLKIYIDSDADVRLARRLQRDLIERGREPESVLDQYLNSVKKMHEKHISPSKSHADIIVGKAMGNACLLELIGTYALSRLKYSKQEL